MHFFQKLARKFSLIVFFIALFFSFVKAQSYSDNNSINDLISNIELKNNITIFYEESWFDGNKLSADLQNFSLNEILAIICKEFNLKYIQIDDYVVFIPTEIPGNHDFKDKEGPLVIGNPMELGRYSRALVSGMVNDGSSGEPLIGAIIYEEKSGTGASTDTDGKFSLTMPVGLSKVKLSYIGYEDSFYELQVISPGTVVLELFEKSHHLEGATITAFRKDANVRSTQMSTIRLDPMMLKELPGTLGEKDVIKSFTLLPGIQSVGEFGTGFNVRGGNSDQNLILVEDIPLFNSSHLFGLVSIVNPDMVTGVTLIKAGIPARYGERASSIIDIRKRGGNPEEAKIRGGLGLLYSRLHFESPMFNRKAFISLGGRTSYSNWLLNRIPDSDLMNSSANFYDVSGVLSINLSESNSLSFFGYQSQDGFLLSGETKHAYTSSLGSVRLNTNLSSSLTSRFTIGVSQYNNSIELPEEVEPKNAFSMKSAVKYSTLKWHFDYKPHNENIFDFGVQVIQYKTNPGEIEPIGSKSFVNPYALKNDNGIEAAAYIGANLEFTPMLSAEIGLRGVWFALTGPTSIFEYDENKPRRPEYIVDTLQFNTRWPAVWSDFGIEPRFGIRYMLSDVNSLKISYNRNHQYINLISNTSVMSPTDVWKLSNRFTDAMVADQLALGYFHLFDNKSIELSIESYLKLFDNIIEYRDGASILMNKYLETDLVKAKGIGYGAELYVTRKIGRLTGWLSYTWSRTLRRTNEDYELFQINANSYFPSSFDRPHSLVLNSTYRFTRRLRVNTTFTYNSGRPVTYPEQVFEYQGHQAIQYSDRNKYRLPDYHRLDLSITYDENLKLNSKGKSSWTLSVINVYGRKNVYSVFYKKEVPNETNNHQKYSLYKLYIIGRPLPTLTYNFSF